MELRDQKINIGRGAGDGPLIILRKVGKSYATTAGLYQALRDIDLEIGAGEFVTLVGKSGSGKTTLLNLIGGIDRPSAYSGRMLCKRFREVATVIIRDSLHHFLF
jgi:ABC-type lipoprotein export system ATPase subunit